MKTISAIMALFAITAIAVSLPATQDQHLRRSPASDLPTVDLTVTDPRFPGKTFHGTAESVYHQMVALNASVFDEEKAGARSLKKRAGEVDCSWGEPIGSFGNCYEGLDYLEALGDASCGADSMTQSRVSCSHGCGMYLYNKSPDHFDMRCADIPADIYKISAECKSAVVSRVQGIVRYDTHDVQLGGDDC